MSADVTVRGLTKSYGRRRAVDDLDLEVGRGVTGLLGPNGAGKTTLLRVLATVLAPDSGEVRLLGEDPRDPRGRLRVRRTLGYLPQDIGFPRSFTAFEAIDYVAVLKEHTEPRARHDEVRRVLDLVGLGEEAGRKVRALSGGMRRRLGLAQALLGTPELLVMDEPTVGLDPEQRVRFRGLVSEAARGRTVVLSTHQTEDVAAVCSQVVVVDRGHALFAGTVRELVDRARGRVWVDERQDPRAQVSWLLGSGLYHHLGDPPPEARLVDPGLEDAYLLLLGAQEPQRSAVR